MKSLLKLTLTMGLVFGSIQLQGADNTYCIKQILSATLKSIQRKKNQCPPCLKLLNTQILPNKIKSAPMEAKGFIFEALITDLFLDENNKASFADCVDSINYFTQLTGQSHFAKFVSKLQEIKYSTKSFEICSTMKRELKALEETLRKSKNPQEKQLAIKIKSNIDTVIKQKGLSKLFDIVKIRAENNRRR